jgi:hypothetical protein
MRGIVALLWNPGPIVLELRRTPCLRTSENSPSSTSFWCEMPIDTGRSSAEPDRMLPSCDSRSTTLPGCLLLRDLGQVMHHYPPAYPSSHPILAMVGTALQAVPSA